MRFVYSLRRSWLLVLIVTVIGAIGGYGLYRGSDPLYRASARLIVQTAASSTGQDQLAGQQAAIREAAALAQAANAPAAAQSAVAAAGLPPGRTTVQGIAEPNQPTLRVVVTDRKAVRAQQIANEMTITLPQVLGSLSGSGAGTNPIQLLQPAVRPATAYNRNLGKDVGFGALGGLVLGLLIGLLRAFGDRRVHTADDIEQILDTMVLGTIPRDSPKQLVPALTESRGARAEAYRQVRTALLNIRARQLNTIAITSPCLGEGKTSVATNLAVVLGRSGVRVVIVDADLRRPRVASFFRLRPRFGLTDVLAGHVTVSEALMFIDDGRLSVLTSGRIPANPSEALGSAIMEEVLFDLVSAFDIVIIDTPPLLPVTDAAVLAPKVDGVIVVANAPRTKVDELRRVRRILGNVHARVLGAVANGIGRGSDRAHRYPNREPDAVRWSANGGVPRADAVLEVAAPPLGRPAPRPLVPTRVFEGDPRRR